MPSDTRDEITPLTPGTAGRLYLDLLQGCLTRSLFPEAEIPLERSPFLRMQPAARLLCAGADSILGLVGLKLAQRFRAEQRRNGSDWPVAAETMIGLKRLRNLEYCLTEVLRNGVPGDLIETGVWRGGACIYMRAVLKAFGDTTRNVWVCDSFEGLPKPDTRYKQDEGDTHWKLADVLAVSLEEVQANFSRYELLDDQVRFLKGWFKDTLPTAQTGPLALLRLDGDMYSSTMDALENLYPRLSSGGYVIIDDYGVIPACKDAVEDYRSRHAISAPIHPVDQASVFWQNPPELQA